MGMIDQANPVNWYALRTRNESITKEALSTLAEEVFLPMQQVCDSSGRVRLRPAVPRLLFFRVSENEALQLERDSQTGARKGLPPFWIYRSTGNTIQTIKPAEINLMRLLTAPDSSRCEIFKKTDFHRGDYVRVSAGTFAGYQGHVVRIRKNLHVVVEIEGVCLIALPYIHPDLLEKI